MNAIRTQSVPAVLRVGQLAVWEVGKLLATSSTRWVLGVILGFAFAVNAVLGYAMVQDGEVISWGALMGMPAMAMLLISPILAVLVMTSDWSTRGVVSYFLLEPRRVVVFAAKVFAALLTVLLVSAALLVISFLIGILLALVAGLEFDPSGVVDAAGQEMLLSALGMTVLGAGIGAALLVPGLAFVVLFGGFFVLGPAVLLLGGDWGAYVDIFSTFTFDDAAGVVSTLVWVVVPFAIGLWRNQTGEVS